MLPPSSSQKTILNFKSKCGFRRKSIAKITPIHVCAKTAFAVDSQKNVGELILSITSCPTIIILENALN
jgi:hypothetical protein